jgi:hypothetical protein
VLPTLRTRFSRLRSTTTGRRKTYLRKATSHSEHFARRPAPAEELPVSLAAGIQIQHEGTGGGHNEGRRRSFPAPALHLRPWCARAGPPGSRTAAAPLRIRRLVRIHDPSQAPIKVCVPSSLTPLRTRSSGCTMTNGESTICHPMRETHILKVVTQRELLFTRLHQLRAVDPKTSATGNGRIQTTIDADGAGVKAGGVGHVEDFPGKAQGLFLVDLPGFG